METIDFFKDQGLDDDVIDKISEAFVEMTKTGFEDEYDLVVDLVWLPTEGLCRISENVFDAWEPEELERLLRDLFLNAAESVVEELLDSNKFLEAGILRKAYDLYLSGEHPVAEGVAMHLLINEGEEEHE